MALDDLSELDGVKPQKIIQIQEEDKTTDLAAQGGNKTAYTTTKQDGSART